MGDEAAAGATPPARQAVRASTPKVVWTQWRLITAAAVAGMSAICHGLPVEHGRPQRVMTRRAASCDALRDSGLTIDSRPEERSRGSVVARRRP